MWQEMVINRFNTNISTGGVKMDQNRDVLQFTMSRLDKIITDADNKANFLLCFSIVILGGMIFVTNEFESACCFLWLLLALIFISFTASSFFSFCAFIPRSRQFGDKLINTPEKSLFFYIDIIEDESFAEKTGNLSDDMLENDFLNQIKQLSLIIKKKMRNIKISSAFAIIGLILLCSFFLTSFFLHGS